MMNDDDFWDIEKGADDNGSVMASIFLVIVFLGFVLFMI